MDDNNYKFLVRIECKRCGNVFTFNPRTYNLLGLKEIPRSCPGCIDQKKDKEIVTLDRVTLQEFQNVLIGELPLRFRQMKYSEIKTPYRIILKGSLGRGVVWDGRFEIYTMIENVIGQTCDIRIMETTRSRKESHILGYHKTAPMTEPILSYVLPGGEVIPVVDGHKEGDLIENVEKTDKKQYMVIEPASEPAEAAMKLVWVEVGYKTTLSGKGRQYHASITGNPYWKTDFSSHCRTGRYGDLMQLAIVDDEHKVISEITGDLRSHTEYGMQTSHDEDSDTWNPEDDQSEEEEE